MELLPQPQNALQRFKAQESGTMFDTEIVKSDRAARFGLLTRRKSAHTKG